VVTGVTALLSRTLPKGVELKTDITGPCTVEGDTGQLGQALMNLCLNASDAMSGTGLLRIHAREVALAGSPARGLGLADGAYVEMSVSDTGCGMDPDTRSRVFEPFFTTKELGRGTGLGLSMVYGTVANHGGAVAVETEIGAGTTITLHLPLLVAARPAPEPPRPPAPAADKQESRLVLVVDDEEMLRRVNRRILERAGYRVMTASDGVDAVEVFRAHRADIGAIVLDMAMPGMGGAECYAALRAVDPSARVILASGFALEKEARDCLEAGALAFLEKPYSGDRLLELVALAHRVQSPRARSARASQPASDAAPR
jgi:two-component system, cell cycle sensor histidine kinase and response regulator CckA